MSAGYWLLCPHAGTAGTHARVHMRVKPVFFFNKFHSFLEKRLYYMIRDIRTQGPVRDYRDRFRAGVIFVSFAPLDPPKKTL